MSAMLTDRTQPQHEVGAYLTIYCGENEGCCFWVRAREWREAEWCGIHLIPAGWWYHTGSYGWRRESTISTEAHARMFP